MARQRFIWPDFWDDLDVAALSRDERLLFIGLFSLADDEGRIIADPRYLKAHIFRYDEDLTVEDVRAMRDRIASVMRSVVLYQADGRDYIWLRQWKKWQKPKYPQPSKLPPPPPEALVQDKLGPTAASDAKAVDMNEGNASETLRNASGNPEQRSIPEEFPEDSANASGQLTYGMGRDGMGRDRVGLGRGLGEPNGPVHAVKSDNGQRPSANPPSGGTNSCTRSENEAGTSDTPMADASPQERAILHELKAVPRYPFRYADDLAYIRRLAVDFPTVDLVAEVKRWRDWLTDHPPRTNWNPRLRFRNWCEIAAKRAKAPQPARASPPVKLRIYRPRDPDQEANAA